MHTKGKFGVWENGDGETGVECDGESICTMDGPVLCQIENARLFAAAPDLLAACEWAEEVLSGKVDTGSTGLYQKFCNDFNGILRAAIAKSKNK